MATSGLRLGDYRADAHLVTGDGVDVYAAASTDTLSRPVTIARVSEPGGMSADAVLDFVRGAAAHATPRVPAVLSTFEDQGRLHIVTTHAPGVDLSAWFAQSGRALLAVDVVVAVVGAIAEATHALHQRSGGAVQHVRPWFVRITDAGDAELCTFGLPPELRAGLVDALPASAARWMTPDALRGLAGDRRSDVHSLGLLAYTMLAGSPPFEGEADLVEAIRRSEPTPLAFLRHDVSPELEQVLAKALASEASARFESADAFARALRTTNTSAPSTEVAAAFRALSGAANQWQASNAPARSDDAETWVSPSPAAPANELAAPSNAPVDEEATLDWDDDEETQVWREDDEEVTVVVAKSASEPSGNAPAIRGAAARARAEALARGTLPQSPLTAPSEASALAASEPATSGSGAISGSHPSASPSPATFDGVPLRHADPAWASRRSGVSDGRNEASEPQPKAATGAPSSPLPARPSGAEPLVQQRRSTSTAWIALVAALTLALVFALFFRSGPEDAGAAGVLQIALSPADALYEVYVDGESVAEGRPPFVVGEIEPGERRLRVVAEGFDGREEVLSVGADGATAVQWQLRPSNPAEPPPEIEATAPSTLSSAQLAALDGELGRAHHEARRALSVAVAEREDAERAAEAQAAAEASRAEEARAAATRAAAERPPLERTSNRPATTRRETARSATPAAPTSRAQRATPNTAASAPPSAAPRTSPPAASPSSSTTSAAAPAPADTAPADTAPGFVNVQSVPAARVIIDGVDTGRYTPILNYELPPGPHRIELVNEDFEFHRTYRITTQSGRTRTVLGRAE